VLQLQTAQVTVDNKPPAIRVITPRTGQTISPDDKTISLEVEATDNVEIDHVEFYHNDQLIDTTQNAPYRTQWTIDSKGLQTFTMIAYDSAGNSTKSEIIRVNVP
jgi:hypothetical protein